MNRFGHIGCLVTKAAINSGKVQVVASNEPFIDLKYMIYMFQHDSTHGKFKGTIKAEKGKIVINGNPIPIFEEQDPTNIKWGDAGAEYVVEFTDVLTTVGRLGLTCRVAPKESISLSLTCCLNKAAKYDDIKKVGKQASEGPLKGILGYTEDQIVSCNFNCDTHSFTFDAGAGIAFNDYSVKLFSAYDNEFGYSNRVVDFIVYTTSKE